MKVSLALAAIGAAGAPFCWGLPSSSSAKEDLEDHGNLRRASGDSPIPPPNADQAAYGFNVLLGMTPSEQRNALIGSKLFNLTGDLGDNAFYTRYEQFEDMSSTGRCVYTGIANEVWYSTSSSSLHSQASSASSGFDRQINLGVEVPVGPATASAETTIRDALVFGNSKSSSNAVGKKVSGYSHSFDAKSRRSLYSVQVGYDDIDTWTGDFEDACSELGDSPTTEQVLNFFHEYGSHGLGTASFGQSCTSSMFMESGETLSAYNSIHSETEDFEAGMLWWKSSSSSSEGEQNGQSKAHGFTYNIADRRCDGELISESDCGGGMKGSGRDDDRPAIIEWTYKPIWEMGVYTLSQGAKDALKWVFEDALEASVACAEEHCNGQGACAPNLHAWGNIGTSFDLDNLFDGSKCFCLDEYEGNSCEVGRSINVESPTITEYVNNWDGPLSFHSDRPLCGMKSEHRNDKEDRRFQLYTCEIEEAGHGYGVITGYQKIGPTQWDRPFTMECEQDKVLTCLDSYHHNGREDRRWTATCSKYKNTKTFNCDDYGSAYINSYDGNLDHTCPVGKVLTGIHAVHHNGHEDRKWKFRCCELQVAEDPPFQLVKTDWSGYTNSFDGWSNAYLHVAEHGNLLASICGVSSYHSNGPEDRRFRYKYCYPPYAVQSPKTRVTGFSHYDQGSGVDCPANSFVAAIASRHSNGPEDRSFRYTCAHYPGHTMDMCYWTDYVNLFDQSFNFECGAQFVLSGVYSHHDNGPEDRRFKFKCCRLTMGDASPNLALHKPTTQSSTAHDGFAHKAVDGDKNAMWAGGSITHTAYENSPYWEVDLLEDSVVDTIILYNRMDCCSERLSLAEVKLIGSDDSVLSTTAIGSMNGESHVIVPIPDTFVVRKVRVQLPGQNYLSLAEVQVLGTTV